MISIKRVAPADAAVISFLGKKTFIETFGYLFSDSELNKYLEDTFGIEKLESSLLKPKNIFSILYYFDKPVGYNKVKIGSGYDDSINNMQVQLQKIYVLRDYLDRKFGKVLLENIFGLAEIEGLETIWLLVLNT